MSITLNSHTLNYQLYLEDRKYKESSHLIEYWNQMQNFYEGKQYPNNFHPGVPKFVANLTKYLVNTKASKIIGTPYVITFQSANNKSANKLDKFDKFVLLDIGFRVKQTQSVINMLVYGTEIVMYRFSDDSVSLNAVYEGKLEREHVDIRKFAVANPYLPNLQKQKWIMVWNYLEVETARNLCIKFKGESDKDFEKRKLSILPDNYDEEDNIDLNKISHELVCVYTRYFRKDGHVCYQSQTKDVSLFNPKFCDPSLQAKVIKEHISSKGIVDYEIDPEQESIQGNLSEMDDVTYQHHLSKFSLYPFAEFVGTRRFNNFYGISDIQDVISAQQVINFLYTMSTKQIQDNAWGKWMVKEGALRGQKINNDGGQVLIDYHKGNDLGIRRVEANSGNMINIVNYITDMIGTIRTLSGATEVITGQNSQQLSGYAISLLQEQGNTVFEMMQSILWDEFAVAEAKIRLQFYLHFYEKKTHFLYELDDIEYENQVVARNELMKKDLEIYEEKVSLGENVIKPKQEDYAPVNKEVEETFSSLDIKQSRYYIIPKAGRGIKYSEVVQADQINQLFKDGTIANMPSYLQKAYIEINPLIDETTKSKFKAILTQQEKSQNAQLSNLLQQKNAQIEELSQVIEILKLEIENAKKYNTEMSKSFQESTDVQKNINNLNKEKIERLENQKETETDKIIQEGVTAAIN